MRIAVTGATGQLGRLVVDALVEKHGFAASDVVVIGRNPQKLAELAPIGVQTHVAEYSDKEALVAAFHGVDRLLLISGSEVGQRIAQHTNVVEAAKEAGVGFIAYTSLANVENSMLSLAVEHRATEELILASGLAHTFLRNGWYTENYTGQLATQLEHGAILGATGDAKVSPATRQDFAEAAAAVLVAKEPAEVYELGGHAVTMPEIAAAVTDVTGTEVVYTDLSAEAYAQVLADSGVPAPFVDVLVSSEQGAAQGDLFVASDDLEQLIGRVPTSIHDAVRAAAAQLG
ncbi:SDR family oxidoreductase [Nocardioides yefusunii]|uniref:SDR family oxidoreductase n=1 Tax=Nocardioides yefusunii TaxID=2500546 RepID=A0ABW1QZX5_9ACTN|nr:SDR family oxidoreductase [Nocardioides yefusunii]